MFTNTTPKLQPISKGAKNNTADNNKSAATNSTTMENTPTRSTNYFKQSTYKQTKQSRNNNGGYGFVRNSPKNKSNSSNTTMNSNFQIIDTTRYKNNAANQHSNFRPYQNSDPNAYVNKSHHHGSIQKLNSYNSYNRNDLQKGNNDKFCDSNDNYKSNNYNSNNINVNYPRNNWETISYNTSYTHYNYNQFNLSPNNHNNQNYNNQNYNNNNKSIKNNNINNNNNKNHNNKITQGRQPTKTCTVPSASTIPGESPNRKKRENPFTKSPTNFSKNETKKRFIQESPISDKNFRNISKKNTCSPRKSREDRNKSRNTIQNFNHKNNQTRDNRESKSCANYTRNSTRQEFNINEGLGQEEKGNWKENYPEQEGTNWQEKRQKGEQAEKNSRVNKETSTDTAKAIKNSAIKENTLINIETKEAAAENNLNGPANEQIYNSPIEKVEENLEKSKKKKRPRKDSSNEITVKEVEEAPPEKIKKDKKEKKTKEKKHKKQKEPELQQELITTDITGGEEQNSDINPQANTLENLSKTDNFTPKISLIPLARLLADEYRELEDTVANTDINHTSNSKNFDTTSNNPSSLKLNQIDQRNRSTCPKTLTTDACDAIMAKLTNMDKSSIKNIINSTDTKYDGALTALARKRLREELRRQLKAINFDNSEQILYNDIVPDEIVDSIHIPDRVLDEIRQALGMDVLNDISNTDMEFSLNVSQKGEDNNNEVEKDIKPIEHFSLMPEEFAIVLPDTLPESASLNTNNSLTDGNNLPTSTTQGNCGDNLNEKNGFGSVTKSLELCLKISPKSYRRNSSSSSTHRSVERGETSTPSKRSEEITNIDNSVAFKKTKKDMMKKTKRLKKIRANRRYLGEDVQKCTTDVIVIHSSSSSSSGSSSTSSSPSTSSTSSSSSDTDSDNTARSTNSSKSMKRRRLKLKLHAQKVIDSFDKLVVPGLSETLTDRYHIKYSTSINTKLHFILYICTSDHNSEKFTKSEIEKIQKNLKSPDYSMALDFLMRQTVNVCYNQKQKAKSGELNKSDSKKVDSCPVAKKSSPLDVNNKLKEQSPDLNNQISSTNETMPANVSGANAATTSKESPEYDDDIRIKQCVSKMLSLYKEEMRAALESVKGNTVASKTAEECSKSTSEAAAATSCPMGKENVNEKELPIATNLNSGEIGKSKGASNILINDSPKTGNQINIYNRQDESEEDSSINSPQLKQQQQPQKKQSFMHNGTALSNENIRAIENISNISTIDYSSFGYSEINSSTLALVQNSALASVDLDSFKQKHPCGDVVVNNLREIDLKLMELHKRKMFIEEMILKLQKEKMEADLLTNKLQYEKFILLNTAMTANATNNERQSTGNLSSVQNANGNMKNIKIEKGENVLSENRTNQGSEVNTTTDASNAKANTKSNSSSVIKQKDLETPSKSKRKGTTTPVCSTTATSPTSTISSSASVSTTTKRRNNSPMTPDSKTKRSNNRREGSTKSKDHSLKSNKIREISIDNPSQKTAELNKSSISPTPTPSSTPIPIPLGVIQSRNIEGIKSVINQIKVYEKNIVAASEDGILYMFDATTLKLIKQFAKHTEAITQMYLCLEKKVIYTTSLDGYLKKTSLENFELDVLSLYLQEPLQSIEVQWGIAYLGSRWGNIYTYNISESRVSENLLCTSTSSIIAIKATKCGTQKILIISSKGNIVQLRDATSGLLLRTLDIPDTYIIYSILLDDNVIYCGTQKREIHKYDLLSGSYLGTLTCGSGAVSMQTYNNRYIFVGCYDGFIYILDKVTSVLKDRLPGSGKMVLALEVYNNKIITSAKDRTMKIIDVPNYCLTNN